MKSNTLTFAALLFLTACSKAADGKTGDGTPAPAERPAVTPEDLVAQMKASIASAEKKPDYKDPEITVQHVLVGVVGKVGGANKSPAEAEKLAAEVYSRATKGEDFDTLVRNYTNDSPPGIYVMSLTVHEPPRIYKRTRMVPAFGDVGWKLAVGEIGVAAYDGEVQGGEPKSPFGYHIIKRLK